MSGRWDALPVGERAVVRRRLPDGYYSDVLGIVAEKTAEGLLVTARSGEVWVPGEIIVASKVIPPAPPRRRTRSAD